MVKHDWLAAMFTELTKPCEHISLCQSGLGMLLLFLEPFTISVTFFFLLDCLEMVPLVCFASGADQALLLRSARLESCCLLCLSSSLEHYLCNCVIKPRPPPPSHEEQQRRDIQRDLCWFCGLLVKLLLPTPHWCFYLHCHLLIGSCGTPL